MTLQALRDALTTSLDKDLARISSHENTPASSLPDILSYRELIISYREKAREAHDHGMSGFAVCAILSDLADRFILHVAKEMHSDSGVAIIALGGYGRRELNPFSDVDLLFLFGEGGEEAHEAQVRGMIQFLWDLNLDIGHSTRSVSECLDAARDDTDLATSLLEGRYLAGNQSVWNMFREQFNAWISAGGGQRLIERKLAERDERHTGEQSAVQVQEPNVKESPGGLRDIHTARWLYMLAGGSGDMGGLRDDNFLYEWETGPYYEGFDFLLRVRNTMHFVTGKKTDLLAYLILPDIAKALGYPGSKTSRTEHFMRDYYSHAGEVHRLTSHIIARYQRQMGLTPAEDGEIPLEINGFDVRNSTIGLRDTDAAGLNDHPETVIRLFSAAASHRLRISGETTWRIEQAVRTFGSDIAEKEEVRTAFHDLINRDENRGGAFRLMHQHGFLVKLIPEFAGISWHYQYNFYHAYTTDEHSIRAVEYIDRISQGQLPRQPELTAIMSDVTARGALALAALLHDVGKGSGAGHSLRGERMAARAMARLGYDDRTTELVRFLIREHLTMSHMAQRRDIEDDETVRDFTLKMESAGRLRMLTILTFADLLSLSATALTDWKKALLLNLFNKSMRLLDREYEQPASRPLRKLVDKILKGHESNYLTREIIQEHVGQLPEQYVNVNTPQRIRSHIRGISRLDHKGVWSSFRKWSDVTLLTVITRDYPKALSDICGTITASDINILGAWIFTRNDGIIIDMFLVIGPEDAPVISPGLQKSFKYNLDKVFTGHMPVTKLIASHADRWKRRRRRIIYRPPQVRIHNDVSTRYTVIDVFAMDYTGLLYDISSVLASFKVDIHTAKIGTDEDRVADAFYVRKSGGGKIDEPELLKEIEAAILDTLNRAYPETVTG